jgi:transketolase
MMLKRVRQQFADTMLDVGQRDPKLAILISDISHFILQPFAKACPGRFYNVGICEPTIISMAAGLARAGLHPVVHTIAPFIVERSFEQIKLDFCYQGLSGNIITVGSAFDYANLGCTHHCYNDFALMKSLPRTQVVYPGSAIEFDMLFKQTYKNDHVTLFRLSEHQHEQSIDPALIKFGKAIRLVEGADLTIIAAGSQLKNAVLAGQHLATQGVSVEIIYIPTVHPLDAISIHTSVSKTKRVLVVEEHNVIGGVADDVRRIVMDIPDVKMTNLGINGFIRDYGTYEQLCAGAGLSVEGILRAAQTNLDIVALKRVS